jgi:serine/threonine-protein kinase SRPK3
MNMFKALRLKAFSRRAIQDARVLPQLEWPEEPLDLPVDRNGGFYPAALGNKLNSTYTIVRKLGWGQHSSVWLAKREGCVIVAFTLCQVVVT